MKRSVAQAGANEATFRLLNERLEQKAGELEMSNEATPYLCECENERCVGVILLRREEYESVRAHPKRFVVIHGHQEADDKLVEERPGCTVIEKQGEEGELVARRDPRSGGSA